MFVFIALFFGGLVAGLIVRGCMQVFKTLRLSINDVMPDGL